jgi:Nif11 domain
MSLDQVRDFYEVLTADRLLYQQYFERCSNQGVFGIRHWNKTKIVDFAATLGYTFTENELEYAWFNSNFSEPKETDKIPEYERVSYLDYEREKAKYPAGIGFS